MLSVFAVITGPIYRITPMLGIACGIRAGLGGRAALFKVFYLMRSRRLLRGDQGL
jgi:hypothetical protein